MRYNQSMSAEQRRQLQKVTSRTGPALGQLGFYLFLMAALGAAALAQASHLIPGGRFDLEERAWVTLIALLLGVAWMVPASITAFIEFLNARRLDQYGDKTLGVVTDTWKTRGGNSISYWVAYEYLLGEKARCTTNPEVYQRVRTGQQIQVVFLPDAKFVSRPDFDSGLHKLPRESDPGG